MKKKLKCCNCKKKYGIYPKGWDDSRLLHPRFCSKKCNKEAGEKGFKAFKKLKKENPNWKLKETDWLT